MPDLRVMLVDPSGRGGLVPYTELVARSLTAAGAEPCVLGANVLATESFPHPFLPELPELLFGSRQPTGARFYTHRMTVWLGGAAATLRATRKRRPDIVHFQHAINRRFDRRLVHALRKRTTVMWTAHDVLPHERTHRDEAWFRRIYQSVDGVIVHSEPAAEALTTLSGVVSAVIEHPVDTSVERLDPTEARERLGLPSSGRVFAALGFIRPYKGYELLADVWEALGDNAPTLLVMGDVHSANEQTIVDRLSKCPHVLMRIGYATESELQQAIAAADALLLPYSGGSDSGLLHLGRAHGTPVIASDSPQLAATVSSTQSGLTLPRSVDRWAAALLGPLPPAPPTPPSLAETGRAHIAAYENAIRGASRRSRGRLHANAFRAA